MAKATHWTVIDAEVRKRGEQTGLDTLVVAGKETPANSVPAAAVIRRGLALFGITGRKAHVGGLES